MDLPVVPFNERVDISKGLGGLSSLSVGERYESGIQVLSNLRASKLISRSNVASALISAIAVIETDYLYQDLLKFSFTQSQIQNIKKHLSEIIPTLEKHSDKQNLYRIAVSVINSCFLRNNNKELGSCWKIVLAKVKSFDFFKEDGAITIVAGKLLESYNFKQQDILPLLGRLGACIQKESPERKLVFHGYPHSCSLHQTWSSSPDVIGIGDLSAHALTLKATPANLCYLLTCARLCPNIRSHSFFENRELARTFPTHLWNLKEIIHYQHPEAATLVSMIICAYDNDDEQEFDNSRKLLLRLSISLFGENGLDEFNPSYLNKNNLDRIQRSTNTSVIETIKQINKNYSITFSIPLFFPQHNNSELSKSLMSLDSEESLIGLGEDLKLVLDVINDRLIQSFDKSRCGFDLNLIEAVLWCDHKASLFLSKITSFESQQQVLVSPCFKSILKFNELTASTEAWDQLKFEIFWKTINQSSGFELRSRRIGARVFERLTELDSFLRSHSREKWLDALWSLNLSSKILQFISMPLQADCKIGKRFADNLFAPPWLFPNWIDSE